MRNEIERMVRIVELVSDLRSWLKAETKLAFDAVFMLAGNRKVRSIESKDDSVHLSLSTPLQAPLNQTIADFPRKTLSLAYCQAALLQILER